MAIVRPYSNDRSHIGYEGRRGLVIVSQTLMESHSAVGYGGQQSAMRPDIQEHQTELWLEVRKTKDLDVNHVVSTHTVRKNIDSIDEEL